MRVTIVGTHGIPARYGGFETFALHLAKALADEGIDTTVINEKDNPVSPSPENVKIISSKYNKSRSPLRFYNDSLKLATGSDIILVCGVGGAFYYNSIRKYPVKIVTNVDGLEHLRKKYSRWQRFIIFILQKFAARQSDFLIADCNEVWGYWTNRFQDNASKMKVIRYGAEECLPFLPSVLSEKKLIKNEYFLVIARLVPENNLDEIIKAFKQYIGKKKLVITGSLSDTPYIRRIRSMAPSNVIFTDAIYDKQTLDTLRHGCFIYLHGHSVGGTNPSLLEAMAAGCACMCYDNVFNREVTEGGQMYFDNSFDLAILLNLLEHKTTDLDALKIKALERVRREYSWQSVCASYIELFNRLHINKKGKSTG